MQHVQKPIPSDRPLFPADLDERTGALLAYGVALAIGLALTYAIFPWDYLLGFVDTVRPPAGAHRPQPRIHPVWAALRDGRRRG
jgi:hypothetical protein